MTNSELLFMQLLKYTPNGVKGTLFGAPCIKSPRGKTAAFYWNNQMVFKLDPASQIEALKLNGAKIGTHIYASEKPMKGWVAIPKKHADKWGSFITYAMKFVEG